MQPALPIRLENLKVPLDLEGAADAMEPKALGAALQKRLGCSPRSLGATKVVRKALDLRGGRPFLSLSVDVTVQAHHARRLVKAGRAALAPTPQRTRWRVPSRLNGLRPVVVGAGPAGLFAALTLANAGLPPILIERGKPVERRGRDVSRLYAHGELKHDSNVCYGEGGAGTYSDGKLYTRTGDTRIDDVLRALVDAGAPHDILVDNRPHIGTDKLVRLLAAMRKTLTDLGATYLFEHSVTDFVIDDNKLKALVLKDATQVPCQWCIVATGHSAREIWYALARRKQALSCRPIAIGFRIEHAQQFINACRYGEELSKRNILPAADYRLAHNEPQGRAYSFCMCPGGVVVTTPTQDGALCINGMSHAARTGRFANSAMVVQVTTDDYKKAGHTGIFAGALFQQDIEHKAYQLGGGNFVAPAQRVQDFLRGHRSANIGDTSYRRGLRPALLNGLLPTQQDAVLRRALLNFERRMPGFCGDDAHLIGVETRTASPIRVERGNDGQALAAQGLYPSGEGMGFGGGIVSAAVDGIRQAENLLTNIGATKTTHVA